MNPSHTEPIIVEVTRGTLVESRHRVHGALCDADGRLLAAWGEAEVPVFPRSAIKPIQAMPLIETGAAERYGLGDAELALACASHCGAPEHLAVARRWLERIGLSLADVRCGAQRPLDEDAAAALAREGERPSALHNNCSGKHLGLLTAARHRDEPIESYLEPTHPAQRRWRAVLGELAGTDLAEAPSGIDGCGIPVLALSLHALARAIARFGAPSSLREAHRSAALRLSRAMAAEPRMVAGAGRLDTLLIEATEGQVLAKGGAEGIALAALRGQGLGLALKCEDGTKRATDAALRALIGRYDEAPRPVLEELDRRVGVVRNWAGRAVGEIRAVLP
ncbi:MAG TPA: asparaginase [Alphaproteobacteria bacterium]|nr:asparaginase [Alphaproteobacteria bacterium]